MIVNCTPRQFEHVLSVADGELAAALQHEHRPTGKGGWFDVWAPYLAWDIVMRRVMEVYLTPSLGKTPSTPDSAMRLLSRIAKAQNHIRRHPALRGAAMLGIQAGWFPVWTDGDRGVYLPTPVAGWSFVVLGPTWRWSDHGERVTVWRPDGIFPRNHWLASEESHTRLLAEQG